jgi:hypothetical protein
MRGSTNLRISHGFSDLSCYTLSSLAEDTINQGTQLILQSPSQISMGSTKLIYETLIMDDLKAKLTKIRHRA